MSISFNELETVLNSFCPLDLAENWDNVGVLVGERYKNINKVLLSLDLTDDVIKEALELKVDLIITHHPLIFKPMKNICDDNTIGKKIITLIKNDIILYTAHTNLDMANGGTNDALFNLLSLSKKEFLIEKDVNGKKFGMGRIGELEKEVDMVEFAKYVKKRLGLDYINIVNSNGKVKRIGLCTGSASNQDFIKQAINKKCDTYITGDISFHNGHFGLDNNINLIDGTHFATESIFMDNMKKYIYENINTNNLDNNLEIFKSSSINKVFTIV